MAQFVGFSSNREVAVDKVCLTGDGWYIEVRPDGDGIEVRSSGTVVGSSQLLVIPNCGNVIRVTNDTLHEIAAHDKAVRLVEVEKSRARPSCI